MKRIILSAVMLLVVASVLPALAQRSSIPAARFHTKAPDFAAVGVDYALEDMLLERTGSGLVFVARIEDAKQSHEFRIDHSNFKS